MALLLVACSGKAPSTEVLPVVESSRPTGTAVTLPTVTSRTPTATSTAVETLPTEIIPTMPGITPFTPTATPQLSPALSAAAIQILSPGPMSLLVSPVTARGYIIPGARNMMTVELIGEDERLIFRKLMRLYTDYKWAYFELEIPFETHAAAELGRLQISTEDENGITTALMAVHVLLQPEGNAEINPPGDLSERCSLLTPRPEMEANGGVLAVGGSYRTFNQQPLIIELIDVQGVILASRWVDLSQAEGGSTILFSEELMYSVEEPTAARLVLRQFDGRIDGNMYLFSQPILVNP